MSDYFTEKKVISNFFAEHGERVSHPTGQFVVHQQDLSDLHMALITRGVIRITRSFANDLERTVAYMLPHTLFSQPGSFFGFTGGRLNFVAETPITIQRIPRSIFLDHTEKDIDLAVAYNEVLARNQVCLLSRIAAQGAKGIDAQCIHWLLFMATYYGVRTDNACTIVVPLTQSSIADMIFATRESVNGALKKIVAEKVISIEHKTITVLDMKRLETLAAAI